MKKPIHLFTFITLIALAVTSCGGGDISNASPKEVFVEFAQRLSKKDYDGAAKLATTESQFLLNMAKAKIAEAPEKKEDEMADKFNNVDIGEAKINGDVANVPIKDKKGEFEMEFPMKKENGAWKVDFTMNSLMAMGKKAMEEGKFPNSDPNASPADMQKAREDMKRAMQMADSGMKALTPEQKKYLKDVLDKANEKYKEEQK